MKRRATLWTALVLFLILCGLFPALPTGVGAVAAVVLAGALALIAQPAVAATAAITVIAHRTARKRTAH